MWLIVWKFILIVEKRKNKWDILHVWNKMGNEIEVIVSFERKNMMNIMKNWFWGTNENEWIFEKL